MQQRDGEDGGRSLSGQSAGPFSRIGLRPRLFFALLVSAFLPLAVFYALGYPTLESSELDNLEKTLDHVARVQARRVNLELRRYDEAARLVASRTQMRRSLQNFSRTGDPDEQDFVRLILEDALRSGDTLAEAIIRDPDGMSVARVGTASGVPAQDPGPAPAAAFGGPLSIGWDGQDGPQLWSRRALELNGENIGELEVRFSMQGLAAVLGDFPSAALVGETSLLLGVNGSGHAFSPDPTAPSMAEELAQLSEAAFAAVRDQAVQGPAPFGASLIRLLELDHGLGYLVVHASTDSIREDLRRQFGNLLAASMLAVIPGVLLVLWLAARIARPVAQLTIAARGLRDGRQAQPIRERFWGEFAELTESYNHAVGLIAAQTRDLYQEIHTRREVEQDLANLANTDTLTGLANRRSFLDALTRLLQAATPSRGALGWLLYLDLDGFKPINDELGHAAGDEVLVAVARRLRNLIREGDVAARLGGDEFALVLLQAERPLSEPEAAAERIAERIARPLRIGDRVVQVGCSVGVIELHAGDAPEAALRRADQAMYEVKHRHRVARAREDGAP